ncbi:hypothetical protein ACTXT7_001911 [Hymenolepis weldensis]
MSNEKRERGSSHIQSDVPISALPRRGRERTPHIGIYPRYKKDTLTSIHLHFTTKPSVPTDHFNSLSSSDEPLVSTLLSRSEE